MGKFHQSKKSHSERRNKPRGGGSKNQGRGSDKLPDDYVYTQKDKSIWNAFCNFLEEKFAEDDLSEISI